MLYTNFTTKAVQYGIEREEKAVAISTQEMAEKGITVKVDEVGLYSTTKSSS